MGPQTSSSYFFLGIDGGYSVSSDTTYFRPDYANVKNYDRAWSVPMNQAFQGSIGASGMIGGFIGYQLNDNVGFNLNYDYRGGRTIGKPLQSILHLIIMT